VCAYELLFGRRPFRGKTNSDLTHSIARDQLKFPEDADKVCSREGMSVLKGLLDRDVTRRLGCKSHGEGLDEIQRHPWFKNIDWAVLEAKQMIPPFQPDQKKANFDATHELEELLLEDNPLKARKRNPNQDINALSTEMRQMEEQFTAYDFKKMQRRSYYPHNQQIMTTITATSSMGMVPSRPVTPADRAGIDSIPARMTDEYAHMPPLPMNQLRGSTEKQQQLQVY